MQFSYLKLTSDPTQHLPNHNMAKKKTQHWPWLLGNSTSWCLLQKHVWRQTQSIRHRMNVTKMWRKKIMTESRHFFLKCIKTALKVVPYYNEPMRPTPASSLYPCNIYRWPLPSLIILFPFIFYHLRGWLTGPQLLFVCHDIWHHRMTECYVFLYLRHASLPWWDPTNIFIAPSPLSFFSVA